MPCSNELCCKWICPALSLSCTYPLVLEKGNKTGFISLLIKHNEVRGPRLMAMAFKNTKLSNRCWDLYFFNLSSNPDNYTTEITIVTAPWRRKCHVKDASGHYLQGCYSHSAAPPPLPHFRAPSALCPQCWSQIPDPWTGGRVQWEPKYLHTEISAISRGSEQPIVGQLKQRAPAPCVKAVTNLLSRLLSISSNTLVRFFVLGVTQQL